MNQTESGSQNNPDESEPSLSAKLRWVYTPTMAIVPPPRAHLLGVGVTPLGRELPDGGGVVVADPRVSRAHAALRLDGRGELFVRDLGSHNGTFVNRRPVQGEVTLRDGDVLRVGDSLLVVRYEPAFPKDAPIESLRGVAPLIAALRYKIHRIAKEPATVLIEGETGTGKELIAQALHQLSGRSGPFIAVNCSAIPDTLAESAWFGHAAGAFTGARAHVGFFQQASAGTLFLDEIGELPLLSQAKLLRALQERVILPVGATKTVAFDVRLIAATNRNLRSSVSAGEFRRDMLGRLGFIELYAPPLRDRREDILSLLAHSMDQTRLSLSTQLAEGMLLDLWPENVRDIQKVATQLRLLGVEQNLRRRFLPPSSAAAAPSLATAASADLTESERLRGLLRKHRGVIRQVAHELGCSRRQIDRLLARYAIDRQEFRR